MNFSEHKTDSGRFGDRTAITIIELLVVIAIIALLATVSVPAIRGLTRSNLISSANRQLLDDIALARQRAINERSIVRVVFVPLDVRTDIKLNTGERDRKMITNLWTGAQTRYALYAERSAGDQPGQHHPRYLTPWRTLPDGVFIPERELLRLGTNAVNIPFPTVDGNPYDLPHISFDLSGRTVYADGTPRLQGEYLETARGSIMFQRDQTTKMVTFFDARENPVNNSIDNFNRVRVDGLTGRARIERPEIQ